MQRLPLAFLVACAAATVAPAPSPPAAAAVSTVSAPTPTAAAPSVSATPSASAAASDDVAPMRVACFRPGLMMRTEALPRSPAFNRGAEAFDRATIDWDKHHYAVAARGFMTASEQFASAGVEGNWKYAWQNAAMAFEAAGHIDEGRAAFEAAAAKDPAHAAELRAAGAKLSRQAGCH